MRISSVSPVASRVRHVERLVPIQSEFNRLPFEVSRQPETEAIWSRRWISASGS